MEQQPVDDSAGSENRTQKQQENKITAIADYIANIQSKSELINGIFANIQAKSEQIDSFFANSQTKSGEIDGYGANSQAKSGQVDNFYANSQAKSNEIDSVFANGQTKSGQIDGFQSNSQTKSGQIDEFHNNNQTKSTEIDEFHTNSQTKSNAITAIHDNINATNNNIAIFLQQFETLKQDIENPVSGLDATKNKSNSAFDAIKVFEDNSVKSNEIIKQAEVSSIQLKDKITKHETDISEDRKTWEKSYDTLYKKIEGLLPGATSTGLAKSYQDQAKKYDIPYYVWSVLFIITMVVMICIGRTYVKDVLDLTTNLKRYPTLAETINLIIERLPIFVPSVWLAVFASKQQSQNRRLREEYAYKETLAKSYESYKREVDNLKETENKQILVETLIKAMVEMSAYNPSHTLQNKEHNDKPPIADLFKFTGQGKSED